MSCYPIHGKLAFLDLDRLQGHKPGFDFGDPRLDLLLTLLLAVPLVDYVPRTTGDTQVEVVLRVI